VFYKVNIRPSLKINSASLKCSFQRVSVEKGKKIAHHPKAEKI
jgi:hypothetical protein